MKFRLIALLILAPISIIAQVRISGKMTDSKNNPLAGASIILKDTYDGTTTDSSGYYNFETYEKGSQVIVASLSGYNTYQKNITIESAPIRIDIATRELITELKAVVITAGAFEASDQKKTTVLTSLDVVTTAGANADIVGALKTLPGTQQVGEAEGLFVRGGTATESKIFIDGMLVNNFFFSSLPGIATRGRFNPFLFKGTVFSAGGYSALYGQALSSALILESKDLPEKTSADLSVSVIGVGGGIQKLGKDKRSSWGFTYNYTNLAPAFAVIKQRQDFYQSPTYHQGDANFRFKTKTGGFVKYYGYLSWNKTGFRAGDIDSIPLQNAFDIENLNTYHNINWKENLGRRWKSFLALSYSTNKDNINNGLQDEDGEKLPLSVAGNWAFKNYGLISTARYAQARWVLEKRWKGMNTLRFGADQFYSREKTVFTDYNGQAYPETVTDNLSAGFAETDFYLTNDVAVRLGGRLEYSSLMKRWNLAPRASLAYKFPDNSQASFAYGIFYQNPERRYLPAFHSDLGYARSTHYILQYQKIDNQRTFRAELFYKNYDNLFKTANNAIGRLVAASNNGYGYARGVEFFWRDRKTIPNFDYWITYSLLDTKRDFLNYPVSMQPNFAAKHTASLVMKKFVLPWKTGFNASYSFASGRPYFDLAYDQAQGKYIVRDQGKTINFNSLSFSLNYLPNLGKQNKKAFIVWVLSVNNVLGQNQVFGYNYSSAGDRKVPILPPSRRFVFIGCFMNFGIDRTQDAINNNL
ncbi:MAG: TonB-dependent receptor [Ferruginibacter sp.]